MRTLSLLPILFIVLFFGACTHGQVTILDGKYSWPARNEVVVENGGNDHLVVAMNGRSKGEVGPGQALIMNVPAGNRRTVSVSVRHYGDESKDDFLGTSARTFRFWGSTPSSHMWVVGGRRF